MIKFTVVNAVDCSTGVVKIGKAHVITEAEKVANKSISDRICKMQQKKQIDHLPE